MLTKSTDGGINFGQPTLVSSLTQPTQVALSIDMVVIGNTVYLVWSENIAGVEEETEIFFSMSVDGGNIFSKKLNLSLSDGVDSLDPAIAVYRNKIHVVWDESFVSPNSEILYRRSLDNGQTFGPTKNLSNSPIDSDSPTIAVSKNQLYVAWSDGDNSQVGSFEIVITKSKNDGTTFDAIQTISNNPGDSLFPNLAVSEDNIYIAWAGFPGGIFFIRSTDSAVTFGATTIVVPDANSPSIAVSQNIA